MYLGCTLHTGTCGDVYPVSVALLAVGIDDADLALQTTFLTYQEPGAVGEGGALQVGVVLPVAGQARRRSPPR